MFLGMSNNQWRRRITSSDGFVKQKFVGMRYSNRRGGPEVAASEFTSVLPVSRPSRIIEVAFAIGSNKSPVGGRITPTDTDSYPWRNEIP